MAARGTLALAVMVMASACSSSAETTISTQPVGPVPVPTVTVVGLDVFAPEDATGCDVGLPIGEWEVSTAVLLPGFVLPDQTEQAPATFRLVFQRGAEDGYDTVTEAAEAATAWLPAEFQPDIRSIVINHLGRNYVFEGGVFDAGGVPGGLQEPCILLGSQAQIAAWYSLQVVDPFGDRAVYWVWQQQGRSIAIEPYVG